MKFEIGGLDKLYSKITLEQKLKVTIEFIPVDIWRKNITGRGDILCRGPDLYKGNANMEVNAILEENLRRVTCEPVHKRHFV